MLVLNLRPHQKVVLPGLGVTIEVVSTRAGGARIGIEAPPELRVHREELLAEPGPGSATHGPGPSAPPPRPEQKG